MLDGPGELEQILILLPPLLKTLPVTVAAASEHSHATTGARWLAGPEPTLIRSSNTANRATRPGDATPRAKASRRVCAVERAMPTDEFRGGQGSK